MCLAYAVSISELRTGIAFTTAAAPTYTDLVQEQGRYQQVSRRILLNRRLATAAVFLQGIPRLHSTPATSPSQL